MIELTFELPHIRLAALSNCEYSSLSSPSKPIVLALHGWLDNAASYLPLVSNFNDYHFVAIEFPGHGKSDHRPHGCYYYFTDWVYDLVALIRHMG